MVDLDLYKVDLTTEQPGGRKGESPRAAFTKHNDMLDALHGLVEHVGSAAPPRPVAYMQWIDTSVSPAVLRRRNAANNAWVAIGPALQALGTAAAANLTTSATDTTPGRVLKVGDFGLGGEGLWFSSSETSIFDQLESRPYSFFAVDLSTTKTIINARALDIWAALQVGLDGEADILSGYPTGGVRNIARVFTDLNCTVTENANGTSYRFPNGLQVFCGGFVSYPVSPEFSKTGAFTQAFIADPITFATSIPIGEWDTEFSVYGGAVSWTFFTRASLGNAFRIFAIGRWK